MSRRAVLLRTGFVAVAALVAFGCWWHFRYDSRLTLQCDFRAFDVAFSPDGRMLASGGSDRTVRLWDVAARTEAHQLLGHSDNVTSVAFAPDGTTIASGSWDGTIRLWDAGTGREEAFIPCSFSAIYGVAFSPAGRSIAVVDPRTVKLVDRKARKVQATLRGHRDWVHRVVFCPDGNRLATACHDGKAKVWDVPNSR